MIRLCGIAGVISSDHNIDEHALNAMVSAIGHRGPDGKGTWIASSGKVGLGHSRLSIIDLSEAGRQPMGNQFGDIQVTFNGEIYNYKTLREQLESKGYRFRSQSDTEVLVCLYEEVGEKIVELLDGDFAFAIWDDRKQQLLMARDRAGVKPIYYTQIGSRFLFASEIKSILQDPFVEASLDQQSLYHYLTYLVVPAPNTMFKGIYKLPAAGFLTVNIRNNQLAIKQGKFWEPLPNKMEVYPDELDDQFQHLFKKSVEKRLMSDVPVGVLFSGGVDSTLNVSVFQEYMKNQRVRTYNVGMTGTKLFKDESEHAEYMAKKLGSEHYSIKISEEDLINTSLSLIGYQDEPISDPVSVPLYFVTEYAKRTGTTVLHAGEGADELFFGYNKYRKYLKQYSQLWNPMNKMPNFINKSMASLIGLSNSPTSDKIADVLLRMTKGQNFFMSSSIGFFEQEKRGILSTEFLQMKYDSHDIVEPLYRRLMEIHPEADLHQTMLFMELQLRLPELLLMRVDKMSMAHGVEVRVPFLDRDLIDFALSVPLDFKMRGGILKEPVKRYCASYIGKEDVYRPKSGFAVPIQDWFTTKLGSYFQELLQDGKNELAEFFDVDEIASRLKKGPDTVNQAFQLWIIFNFLNWRNRFIK
ncbi:asparagine synthase (glutamine-hydrolyzing) [Cohnella cholangitidis]|nr:asparagine synthase (glutamine-hydrolyzing) [Cohnella cholangitidis]